MGLTAGYLPARLNQEEMGQESTRLTSKLRERLARKKADLAFVGGGTIVLTRAEVETLVEVAEAAKYARDYILARTYKRQSNHSVQEFVVDVEYILGDAEPTAQAGQAVLKTALERLDNPDLYK